MNTIGLTMGMSTQTLISPTLDGITERVDPIDCLDERIRSQANDDPTRPGRYIEVQGSGRTLLIPIGEDVIHIGRGLSAGLHLDESSVSRRHAILVPRPRALAYSMTAAPTAPSSTDAVSSRQS